MKSFKVGDKVTYNGDMVGTIVQVYDPSIKLHEAGWLREGYVVLSTDQDFVYNTKELEHYKSPHKKLLELGFEPKFNNTSNLMVYESEHTVVEFLVEQKMYTISSKTKPRLVAVDRPMLCVIMDYLDWMEKDYKGFIKETQ